jgi:hypothetical protein
MAFGVWKHFLMLVSVSVLSDKHIEFETNVSPFDVSTTQLNKAHSVMQNPSVAHSLTGFEAHLTSIGIFDSSIPLHDSSIKYNLNIIPSMYSDITEALATCPS